MGTETAAASLAATFVGHATVLIEADGARILTDPLLRLRVGVLIRQSPVPPASVYRDLDALVISHAHLDHLDVPSLRLIDKETPVLAPAASLSWRSAPFISASVSSTRAREAGRRLFEAAETDLAETALC